MSDFQFFIPNKTQISSTDISALKEGNAKFKSMSIMRNGTYIPFKVILKDHNDRRVSFLGFPDKNAI